ncbi:MAG: hypothetical protein K6U87_11010 [Firmicutes bacterium]|nr:hypothetical protein [Bacillota bacterium]
MSSWELWVLTNSSLPTGGFARSHGLETLVEEGRVKTAEDLRWLLPRIVEEAASTEGVALWHVLRAPPTKEAAAAVRATRRLATLPWPEEVRQANRAQGGRLLRVARSWGWPVPGVKGEIWSAPAFGLLAVTRRWDPETTVAAYLFTIAQEVVGAWCRLIRGDPNAAWGELLAVKAIAQKAAGEANRPLSELASTSWWLEGVRARHATQMMRLFRT